MKKIYLRHITLWGVFTTILMSVASDENKVTLNVFLHNGIGIFLNALYSALSSWWIAEVVFLVTLGAGTVQMIRWINRRMVSFYRLDLWVFAVYMLVTDEYWTWAILPVANIEYRYVLAAILVSLIMTEGVCLIQACAKKQKKRDFTESHETQLFIDEDETEDLLHFGDDAKRLVKYLMDNVNEQSAVGVSVTGKWGTGKTTFMRFMADSFRGYGIRPIGFNPWKNKTDNPEDALLRSIIKEAGLDKEVCDLLTMYADKLKINDITGWFSVLVLAVKRLLYMLNDGEPELKQKLMAEMRVLERPVVVFIDDSDRLEFNAFKDVLSLIRGTADLPKIIYIVAFDAERAKRMLIETGDDKFMQKMFNVPHVLTPVTDNVMCDFVTDKILRMKIPYDRETHLLSSLKLTEYLSTFRDAKRFVNMVYKDWLQYDNSKHKEQIVWSKWVLVELLRFYDGYTFLQLKDVPERFLEIRRTRDINDTVYQLKVCTEEGLDARTVDLIKAIYADSLLCNPFDVTNKVYHSVYFDPHADKGLLAYADFMKNYHNDNLVDVFKGYLSDGVINLHNLIGDVCRKMPPAYAFGIMESYLEAVCTPGVTTWQEFFNRNKLRRYMDYVQSNPFLGTLVWLCCAVVMDVDEKARDKMSDEMYEHCMSPKFRYVRLALLVQAINSYEDDELIDTRYYFVKLLEKMADEATPDYSAIIYAICGCTQYKVKQDFTDSFLERHFVSCIPFILILVENDKTEYLLVRHNVLRGLFDTYTLMCSTIKRWKKENIYDTKLLEELMRLVNAVMTFTPMHPEKLLKERFPLLSGYTPQSRPVHQNIRDIEIKKGFWKQDSRYKMDLKLMFATDINE